MDANYIKSRYKVIHVLRESGFFSAVLAVDIESRDKTEYLLNIYKSSLTSRYVDVFDKLKHCNDFVEKFIFNGTLTAVFRFNKSTHFNDVFNKNTRLLWQERLDYAQLLFHHALSVSDYPAEVARAALEPDNIFVNLNDKKLVINYVVSPEVGDIKKNLISQLAIPARIILTNSSRLLAGELDFLEQLESKDSGSIASVYSAWQSLKTELTAEYEKLDKMNFINRWFYLVLSRSRFNKKNNP
jgi:hypothetical protein